MCVGTQENAAARGNFLFRCDCRDPPAVALPLPPRCTATTRRCSARLVASFAHKVGEKVGRVDPAAIAVTLWPFYSFRVIGAEAKSAPFRSVRSGRRRPESRSIQICRAPAVDARRSADPAVPRGTGDSSRVHRIAHFSSEFQR